MEIERKFIPKYLPKDYDKYPKHQIEQGYLSTNPVVRVRKSDDRYYLTYKSGGMMEREEYNLPLTVESYRHLIQKADGNIIAKTRFLIPIGENLTAELDIFEKSLAGLIIAEVEFSSTDEAKNFSPPEWFGKDVTFDRRYHNSFLSQIAIKRDPDI